MQSSVVTGCSLAFGGVDAWLWCRHGQTFWLANISSLYLALAFLAGVVAAAPTGRATHGRAAVAGAAAPLIALTAFYGAVVERNQMSLVPAEHAFLRYAVGGVLLGSLFGIAGSRWRIVRSRWSLAALGVAMFLEPVAWRVHLGFLPHPVWQWVGEAALGVALGLVAHAQGRSATAAPA